MKLMKNIDDNDMHKIILRKIKEFFCLAPSNCLFVSTKLNWDDINFLKCKLYSQAQLKQTHGSIIAKLTIGLVIFSS